MTYASGSPEKEVYYPKEENLGRNCSKWDTGKLQCGFPKAVLIGRTSCEGMIDDICLYLKDNRVPTRLTDEQKNELTIRPSGLIDRFTIPPGDIV